MAKRQKEWARRKREAMLAELGGKCAYCGATERLEFDCKIPCGDSHHKLDSARRISFYTRQLAIRNLQILCQKCNAIKGAREKKKLHYRNHYATARSYMRAAVAGELDLKYIITSENPF